MEGQCAADGDDFDAPPRHPCHCRRMNVSCIWVIGFLTGVQFLNEEPGGFLSGPLLLFSVSRFFGSLGFSPEVLAFILVRQGCVLSVLWPSQGAVPPLSVGGGVFSFGFKVKFFSGQNSTAFKSLNRSIHEIPYDHESKLPFHFIGCSSGTNAPDAPSFNLVSSLFQRDLKSRFISKNTSILRVHPYFGHVSEQKYRVSHHVGWEFFFIGKSK